MTARKSPRPSGGDEIREAILEAASEEFAAKGTAASLREIAAAAGVHLSLIDRYYGTKDDLLRAVLARNAQGGRRVVDEALDVAQAMHDVFLQTTHRDRYIRIVAWLLLAGVPADKIQTEYPAIRALRDRGAHDGVGDLDVLAAFALTYGWTVFGDQLLDAFDRREQDRSLVQTHLGNVLARILQP
jgi:AcrR family transcriptional regulator